MPPPCIGQSPGEPCPSPPTPRPPHPRPVRLTCTEVRSLCACAVPGPLGPASQSPPCRAGRGPNSSTAVLRVPALQSLYGFKRSVWGDDRPKQADVPGPGRAQPQRAPGPVAAQGPLYSLHGTRPALPSCRTSSQDSLPSSRFPSSSSGTPTLLCHGRQHPSNHCPLSQILAEWEEVRSVDLILAK